MDVYISAKRPKNDTFIPTVHLHEWISPSYILKWKNAEIVKKYVGRFTTPLKDTQKDDKKPYQMF